ncbi:MAG: protein-L-isoaspartate(D-aspartate) O-methyltransferase [Candidatus Woesearchaeota archaeon]
MDKEYEDKKNKDFKKQELIDYWRRYNIIRDESLLEAFKKTRRENFVLDEYKDHAYIDAPLPILNGQTISQPTTIMIMLQALELKPDDCVLEIGAGSGYVAAIMSHLCKKIYAAEIIPQLVEFAKQNLKNEGIKNVIVLQDDGKLNYKNYSPFDKIIVSCACPKIPDILIKQLKENGLLVIPVGPINVQEMFVIRKGLKKETKNTHSKSVDQELSIKSLGEFIFVPLQGNYGY